MRRDTAMVEVVKTKYEAIRGVLDERARRLWAAAEALAYGYGGTAMVSAATGLSGQTIRAGLRELAEGPAEKGRVRKPGGGRKRAVDLQPGLLSALEKLVSPTTRGDPESSLRWTLKSRSQLARELQEQGFKVSSTLVGRLLNKMDYRLQAMRKTREGSGHDDRDTQFEYINGAIRDHQARGEPTISVDTKKKELVGDFKKAGVEWQPKGQPEEALVYDFAHLGLGKAIPYGVYDIARNEGWVTVGTDHDTPRFAVEGIRKWWLAKGRRTYRGAKRLLITADGGGSNGHRPRAWKTELQKFANETGLAIHVCHYPPGTSKWNKIEHRLFSFITINWRGRALTCFETVVKLIQATKTTKGLKVRAVLDSAKYPAGEVPDDEETRALNIHRSPWHGDWNYTIRPQLKQT